MLHNRTKRTGLFFALAALLLLGACTLPTPQGDAGAILRAGQNAPQEIPAASAVSTEAPAPEPVADSKTSESQNAAAQPESDSKATVSESAPAEAVTGEETHHGIPVGFTAEGRPYRGSPDAPVIVNEYSDYHCPFCSRHVDQTEPALLETYAKTGKAQFVFWDFPIAQLHPNAAVAHLAALCVADQGAALFWEMHDQIFATQAAGTAATDTAAFYSDLAAQIGADMTAFAGCIDGGEKAAILDAHIAEGRAACVSGTPNFDLIRRESGDTYYLDGAYPFASFDQDLTALLAGELPTNATTNRCPELPYWITPEGLAQDPDAPDRTVAGDYFKGDPNAGVVVIEFSDFECPYCSLFTEQTLSQIDENYMQTGKIFWVFKHFPLSNHPHAPLAAAAAECAGDQGKFWEMHDLLFADVQAWATSNQSEVLNGLAGQLELDADQFAACLESDEAMQRVNDDLRSGQGIVSATPSFIVWNHKLGLLASPEQTRGALPWEFFDQLLTQAVQIVETQGGE